MYYISGFELTWKVLLRFPTTDVLLIFPPTDLIPRNSRYILRKNIYLIFYLSKIFKEIFIFRQPSDNSAYQCVLEFFLYQRPSENILWTSLQFFCLSMFFWKLHRPTSFWIFRLSTSFRGHSRVFIIFCQRLSEKTANRRPIYFFASWRSHDVLLPTSFQISCRQNLTRNPFTKEF